MQISEAGDLKEANDLQADEDKEMQVSEAGDLKKADGSQGDMEKKCQLVKQVIQKRLMIHKKVIMIKNASQ